MGNWSVPKNFCTISFLLCRTLKGLQLTAVLWISWIYFQQPCKKIPLSKLDQLILNFVGVFSESHVLNVEKANLGLKTLHMAPRSLLTEFEEYYKLLSQLAPTLEDVKLTSCSNLSNLEQYIFVPNMPKLKTLTLQSWRGGFAFWNLTFINQIPNLEALIIESREFFAPNSTPYRNTRDLLEEEDVRPHKNLTYLVLPSAPMQFPGPDTLTSLLLKFPFLKSLTLSTNDSSLQSIFHHATQLENLTIAEYSKITDNGITGLINTALLPEGIENDNYNLNIGITSLKELKRLEIDGFGGEITDFSLQYGVKHLEKLESVILRSCKISKHGINMLSKMHLTVLEHDTWRTYEQELLEDPYQI